ncbi:unnamed protein product [Mesocestoides corti]|nr:unnamed protein product [Mesocestoides corti]
MIESQALDTGHFRLLIDEYQAVLAFWKTHLVGHILALVRCNTGLVALGGIVFCPILTIVQLESGRPVVFCGA